MVRTRRIFFALALCTLSASVSADVTYLVDEPGRWSPWKFRSEPFTSKSYGASAADLKGFDAQLRTLDAIIRRAPAVAQPVGFSAQTWGHLSGYAQIAPGQPKGSDLPLGGGLTFGAFAIFEYERNGKTLREVGGETQLMQFVVNDIQPELLGARQRPYEWEGVDTDAFMQPAEAGTVAGFPRYGNYIMINKRQDPLWVPVSLAGALRLVIAAQQKRLDYLKETRGPAKVMRDYEQTIAAIEAHIAALPAGERLAPACIGNGTSWQQRFHAAESSGCTPLVRPNWAFFDRRLPRATPQVLLVNDIARCYEGRQSNTPGGCTTNRQLLESLDRQALMDWLH
jgi:hypothetical protein